MADNYRFAESDSLLCYHGPMLYEAKCLQRRKTNDGKAQYFIHYKGWNSKWEEWVDDNRVLTVNAANMNKMASLKEIHSNSKKSGTKRSITVVKEETIRNTTPPVKGRKRKHSELSTESNSTINVPSPSEPKPKKRGRPPKISITSKIEETEAIEEIGSTQAAEEIESTEKIEGKQKSKINEMVEEKQKNKINEIIEEKPKSKVNEIIGEKQKSKVNEIIEEKQKNKVNEIIEEKQKNKVNEINEEKQKSKVNEIIEEKQKSKTNELIEEKQKSKVNEMIESVEAVIASENIEETQIIEGSSSSMDSKFIVPPSPLLKTTPIPVIDIPLIIKQRIAYDHEKVKFSNLILRFPKELTIYKIIRNYIDSKANVELRERAYNVGLTLIQYFNVLIHSQLFYRNEHNYKLNEKAKNHLIAKIQNNELTKIYKENKLYPKKLWHYVYGPTHLIRLFVNLPLLISTCDFTEVQFDFIVRYLNDFLIYLANNFELYFTRDYFSPTNELKNETNE